MKLLLIILGVAAIALNAVLWYAKKQAHPIKADKSSKHQNESDGSHAGLQDFENNSKIKSLKESAAAELGITVDQLESMSAEEIKDLATEKKLIR